MLQNSPEQWLQQAMAASRRQDHRSAIAALEQAIALAPGDAGLFAHLAAERLQVGDIEGARRTATAGLQTGRQDARSLARLGFVFSRTNDFSLAVDLYRQAVALSPTDPAIHKNLAWCEQYVGDFPAARASLGRALALSPEDDQAWFSLSGLPDWRPSQGDILALINLLDRLEDQPDRSLGVGHALSRAQESRGDFEAALATLIKAKAPRKIRRPYDVQVALKAFLAAPQAWRNGPRGPGAPSAAPIFVVGPPRSGTTLLDRILSSHRAVVSVGEPQIIPRLALRIAGQSESGPITAQVLARTADAPAAQVGDTYLRAVAPLVGGATRFVDKSPFNLIFAGMISRSLPEARILRMRRPAADTVVGNFRQFFAPNSLFHDYSYDLEDVARYVVGMETLSEAWEALLPPDRYRVVDYASLVADPEGEIRRVLDFCGLDWDPACLAFHTNVEGVSTASAVQVREPLHQRNLDIWRRYGDGLSPALDVLRAAGRL